MKKIILIASLVAVVLPSCRRGDDLYVNPNNPAQATPKTLLASIEVQTMNSFEGELTRTASVLMQHNVGVEGQATQAQVYSMMENQFDNQWSQLYQTLNNCQVMITSFGADHPYYKGITEVLMAMNWGALTDLWGDIPYTEALQGQGNYKPKYDAQEVVYNGIIKLLDDAIADLGKSSESNLTFPGEEDFIYGGDVTMWQKAAHTLKARYMNRFSNKATYDPAAILNELSMGISSSAENMMAVHGGGANESNQWYAFLNARAYLVAGASLVDSMLLRPTDQRVYYYFDSTGFGTVVGSPIDVTTEDASYWGSYLAGSPATPTPLVTYSEAKFIEAEAKVRLADASAAASLNEAIEASASEVTNGAYSGMDIATYTAANTTLSRVMYEKWIAMFGQMEVWTDYRRTHLPELTPNPDGVISKIPERYPTPQSERVSNPNAPVLAVSDPVWFAKP